jgi:hypothetical protein
MKRRRYAALAALVCLFAFGSVKTHGQDAPARSFFSTLSYDTYVGGIYDWYHGYSIGARAAVPLFTLPTLNSLFSLAGEPDDDLLLLPGLRAGSIGAGGNPLPVRVVYAAPELALHYSFLRFSGMTLAAGPSYEFIYTNNYNKYEAIPSVGIDLGMMVQLARYFQLGLEQRWIVHEVNPSLTNVAGFPQKPFSHLGLVIRFSLPWKSEQEGYEAARSEYEQKLQTAAAAEQSLSLSHQASVDSLTARVKALEASLDRAQKKKPVPEPRMDKPEVDPFNAKIMTGDPEYRFTKDPFEAGNLVNDGYLKNVLIDILDDGYVWQLRTNKRRRTDAEKIRAYFVLYDSMLSRRIVLAEDETVPLFTLRCLGKAAVPGSE